MLRHLFRLTRTIRVDDASLTFTAEGLPSGLVIDPETGVITGTLLSGTSADGPYVVAITATDAAGASVTTEFVWEVENVDPVIVSPLPAIAANDGEAVTIPTASNFGDTDGDDLTFSATGLPEGLMIDPETGVISGTISGSSSVDGPYEVTVTVSDPEGGEVSSTFTLDVSNPAPEVDLESLPSGVLTDEVLVGAPFVMDVGDIVSDPDGDAALSFSSDELPAGITLDPDTGRLSGVPTEAQDEPYAFTVYVSDGEGGVTPIEVRLMIMEDGFVGLVETPQESILTEVDPYEFLEAEAIDLKQYFFDRALDNRDSMGRMFGDRDFLGGMAISQITDFSNQPAYIAVEALAYDHHISVQLASPMDISHDITIESWDVDMANGGDLPNWVEYQDGTDFMQISLLNFVSALLKMQG